MRFRRRSSPRRCLRLGLGLGLVAAASLVGCARAPFSRVSLPILSEMAWLHEPGRADEMDSAPPYDFFGPPRTDDPWSVPIGSWRQRQRAALRAGLIEPFPALPPVSAAPDTRGGAPEGFALSEHYDAFLEGRRRELAREVVHWVQGLARKRFVEDGPVDHWPTLFEVLHSAGDDCDGLELLSYHALRQLGFPPDQIYRAIVHRPDTGQHHMVTLWFEDARDPWVLDPTDTITSRLRRLSELPEWIPLKLFSEAGEFTVTRRGEDETGQETPTSE